MLKILIGFFIFDATLKVAPKLWATGIDIVEKGADAVNNGIRNMFELDK